MRILFVTPYLPDPPRSGGPRRLHGLIRGLARSHGVSIISLVNPGEDYLEAARTTAEYCEQVVTVVNDRYGTLGVPGMRKRLLQVGSMLSTRSYERLLFHRPVFQEALDRMTRAPRFDIVNVEFSLMAQYRLPRGPKLVLDEHNIEYDVLRRTARVERSPLRKLYSYLDYLKLRREEQAIWRKFDGCVLTSARDQGILGSDFPQLPTRVVPNAVDADFFQPGVAENEPQTVLFFGAMDYHPNSDGIGFFLKEILPTLKRRYPNLKLQIVGQAPPATVRRWASNDVTITGFVDDVRPYLARAAVVIAPLRIGGGTRLKIVEAMAMGKAIVSTTLGAEGIDVTHGEDILLADTPEAFAAQVSRLLDTPGVADRLGRAARRLVLTRYTWQAAVRGLEEFYGELLDPTVARFPGNQRQSPPIRLRPLA